MFVWDYDELVIRNYVAQFQEGTWPDAAEPDAASASTSYCQ